MIWSLLHVISFKWLRARRQTQRQTQDDQNEVEE